MINRTIVMDTSIASENGGDSIIMDCCCKWLYRNMQNTAFCHVPTHDYLSKGAYNMIRESQYCIVCGTNLINSNMWKIRQWKIGVKDLPILNHNVILMGVGWWQYQGKPDIYTRKLLKHILCDKYVHSVRDRYTENMLKGIGIENVIYTGCPTMWELTADKVEQISKRSKKSQTVVLTLTDYNKEVESDRELVQILRSEYSNIAIWIQSVDDYKYIKKIGIENDVEIIAPPLKAYDTYLETHDVDYIGTRLHAGIRALNYGKRALIIAIDNRSIEIARDTGLPIIRRDMIEENLKKKIEACDRVNINMPWDSIDKWTRQFI